MSADSPVALGQLLDGGRLSDDTGAVTDPDRTLTYGELRAAADRLHAVLTGFGVRPGDRVGIHLESSVETMVAVHGVLRAGGVVVPLDPRAPVDHVARLLRDCDIAVLVGGGTARRVEALHEAHPLRAVIGSDPAPTSGPTATPGVGGCPDLVAWSEVAGADPVPPVAPDPDAVAYVIYTSGSTGTPKGIVHTHRSGLAYARLAATTYDLRPNDVVATLSPLHFDQSTFSLYAAPLRGSGVLMVPDAILRFPASLTQLIADHGVTVWYSVPTLLTHVLRRGVVDERDLSAIRWILYGGESFPAADLAALMACLPAARISNVYGPAEVNQCTYFHVPEPPTNDEPIPIGRAWPETEILVVDDEQNPVSDGAEGEILVGSSTAMEGYWNRPDLTADAFRERRGPDGTTTRWYATGDLARWRSDGELVFIGRVDNQVKVRGYRVELEAVDLALAGVTGVDIAVTVVRPGTDGTGELLAVVVPSTLGSPPDPVALRRQLARALPPYAVPSDVVFVDHLPRTATGKIDRRSAAALASGGS